MGQTTSAPTTSTHKANALSPAAAIPPLTVGPRNVLPATSVQHTTGLGRAGVPAHSEAATRTGEGPAAKDAGTTRACAAEEGGCQSRSAPALQCSRGRNSEGVQRASLYLSEPQAQGIHVHASGCEGPGSTPGTASQAQAGLGLPARTQTQAGDVGSGARAGHLGHRLRRTSEQELPRLHRVCDGLAAKDRRPATQPYGQVAAQTVGGT